MTDTAQGDVKHFGTAVIKEKILLPNNVAAATSTDVDYFERFQHTSNWSGPFTALAGTIFITRFNNKVWIDVRGESSATGAAAAVGTLATAVPARFRPTAASAHHQPTCHVTTISNAVIAQGNATITSAGVITITTADALTGVFSATGGANGWYSFCLSYDLSV